MEKVFATIVNQTFAGQFFPNENPRGRRLLTPDRKHAWKLVGVVADYRPLGAEKGNRPTIFYPHLRLRAGTLVIRTAAAPEPLKTAAREAVRSLDRDLSTGNVETMESDLEMWQSERKFFTLLLAGFAGLALVPALTGIYGVLSHLVASRVRAIGVRTAPGAARAEVARLVIVQTMKPAAAGAAAGPAGALILGRFLEALLFQVHGRDPLTLALSTAAILLAALAAAAIPLRRGLRIEYATALRQE